MSEDKLIPNATLSDIGGTTSKLIPNATVQELVDAVGGSGGGTLGLTQVAHDDTLTGNGTTSSPLGVVGSGSSEPPNTRAGYVMQPEVIDFDGVYTFTLAARPKFIVEAMVLTSNSFFYLQTTDYDVSGDQFTVKNVTLNTGDKIKVTYAI